jgi:DNA polymerase-3 subunit delta'
MNLEECPDLYILENDEESVGKDDIKELIKKISTTSQFNSKKVYIINNCEKLNDTCNNAILKTLEEPQEGIYAILITNNIDSVIPTISSRCQKIFISTSSEESIDESYYGIADEIIKNIESNGIKTIAKMPEIYSIIKDRNELKKIYKTIFKRYSDSLNSLVNDKKEDNIILKNNDIVKISKKLLIINENINRLNSYLNKNLSIDRLIIDMWRCDK